MKTKFVLVVIVLLLAITGFISVRYYSYVFAKTVRGEIIGIERVTEPSAIIGSNINPAQIFSFAIAIKDSSGEIVTSSSEDRQWAVAQKGQCAEAKFFPYPPWNFDKAGTFYGARLVRLFDCPGKAAPTAPATPSGEPHKK